jgi:predicted RNA-binding Zn-ribbon protein involved in translation (DUF1610 family)
MSTAILHELLEELAPERRQVLQDDYQALQALPGDATDLQAFLDAYLARLTRLYGATAAAVWLRSPPTYELQPRSRYRYPVPDDWTTNWDAEPQVVHMALLQHAAGRTKSILLSPQEMLSEREGLYNPSQEFLLLGPIDRQGERIGVVELILGPQLPGWCDRQRLVQSLDHLLLFLRQGIQLRYLGSAAPLQPAMINLAAAKTEIEAFQEAIRKSLEVTLNHHAGWNFGSLRNNQTFTTAVHQMLDTYGLRVACPECGAPAILRCQAAGNARTGVFLYDHTLDKGRTFHGGPTTFPQVKLVPKPPRRKGSLERG